MNILITGSSGFVGAHLVRALSDNHTIYGLDKYNTEYIGFKKIHRGKQGLQDINEIEEDHRIVAWRHRQEITEDRYIQIPDWAFSFESFESPDKPLDLIINCGSLSEAILSQYYKEFTFNSIMKGYKTLKNVFLMCRLCTLVVVWCMERGQELSQKKRQLTLKVIMGM